ncbi:MAG: ClpP family protease [Ignavibacteriales bacterium]
MENKDKGFKRFDRKKEEKSVSSVNLLDKKRIMYLDGEIDDNSAKEIIETLLKLDTINNKDITMYINSGGGSVSAGLAIYDVMNMIKSDVKTICIGRCASMASILLINGARGKRYILENAEIMIHEVSSGTFGKVTEMQEKLDHSKILNNKLHKIIAQKTKKSLKEVKRDTLNKDSWMNSSQALRWGFVDEIVGRKEHERLS